jgi:hypothetical protein
VGAARNLIAGTRAVVAPDRVEAGLARTISVVLNWEVELGR